MENEEEKQFQEDFKWLKGVFIILLAILAVGIIASFILLFIANVCQNKTQEIQIVEYALENPCGKKTNEVYASLLNRFPYKKTITTKSDSCFYIAYMIFGVLLLSVIIICLTIVFTRINNLSFAIQKISAIKSKFDEKNFTENDSKVRSKAKTTETDYYPKNKVLVDNFKAYANAIAEL